MYGTLPLLVPAVVKPQLSTAKIRDLDQDVCIHSVVIVELFWGIYNEQSPLDFSLSTTYHSFQFVSQNSL